MSKTVSASGVGYAPNYAGQVRANYTGLSLVGFVDAEPRTFVISGASTTTLSAYPTTRWPKDGGNKYSYMYDSANNRLKENARKGQVHTWRLIGTYANKTPGVTRELTVEMFNPDSGFVLTSQQVLPSGSLFGAWSMNFITIADDASLPVGRGYQLRAMYSETDGDFTVVLSSITRLSAAFDRATPI